MFIERKHWPVFRWRGVLVRTRKPRRLWRGVFSQAAFTTLPRSQAIRSLILKNPSRDFNSSGGMRTLTCFAFASLRLDGIASSLDSK
jgi:hypothetical protein